jgi:hypothetical protein
LVASGLARGTFEHRTATDWHALKAQKRKALKFQDAIGLGVSQWLDSLLAPSNNFVTNSDLMLAAPTLSVSVGMIEARVSSVTTRFCSRLQCHK